MVSLRKPKKKKRVLRRYYIINLDVVLRYLGKLVTVRFKALLIWRSKTTDMGGLFGEDREIQSILL